MRKNRSKPNIVVIRVLMIIFIIVTVIFLTSLIVRWSGYIFNYEFLTTLKIKHLEFALLCIVGIVYADYIRYDYDLSYIYEVVGIVALAVTVIVITSNIGNNDTLTSEDYEVNISCVDRTVEFCDIYVKENTFISRKVHRSIEGRDQVVTYELEGDELVVYTRNVGRGGTKEDRIDLTE